VQIQVSSGVFNNAPFAATATVTALTKGSTSQANLQGVSPTLSYSDGSGVSLSGPPTDPGSYTVFASFAGSDLYAPSNASRNFVILKAVALVKVTNADSESYDGNPHYTTAFVTDAAGQNLSEADQATITFTYSTPDGNAPSAVGAYQVTAKFPGNKDYLPATGTGTIKIGLATTNGPAGGPSSTSLHPATPAWSALKRFAEVDPSTWVAPTATEVPVPALPSGQGLYPTSATTLASWPAVAGSLGLYDPAPIAPGLVPSNAALRMVWAGSGAAALFGKVAPPPLQLALTGTLVTSPLGGQYILPGQGGLTAPTGGLAALAANAGGLTALETQSDNSPSILGPDWSYQDLFSFLSLPLYGMNFANIPSGPRFNDDWQYSTPHASGTFAAGPITITVDSLTTTLTEGWTDTFDQNPIPTNGPLDGNDDGSGTFSITVTKCDSANHLLWVRTLSQTITIHSQYEDYYENGVAISHWGQSSGTITNSDNWVVFLDQSDELDGLTQTTKVRGTDTNQISWSTTDYSYKAGDQLLFNDSASAITLARSHRLSADGEATEEIVGGNSGRENFSYEESADRKVSSSLEVVALTGQVLTVVQYADKNNQRATWLDLGNETKPGDASTGQDTPLVDRFSNNAAFRDNTYTQINGASWGPAASLQNNLSIFVDADGSASQSTGDVASGSFSINVALADGEPGVLGGNEIATKSQTFGVVTEDNEQLSTGGNGAVTMNQLLASQDYTNVASQGDRGNASAQAFWGTDSDVYSDTFDTGSSANQHVSVTLSKDDTGTSLATSADGTLSQNQSNNGSDQFQAIAGLGPQRLSLGTGGGVAAQRFAAFLASPAFTETDQGSDSFHDSQQTTTTYNVNQVLHPQNAPQDGLFGGPWITDSFHATVQPQRTYSDTLQGNAQVTDTTVPTTPVPNSESDTENDFASVNFNIPASGTDTRLDVYSGVGTGATLTVSETGSDTCTPVLSGTENDSSLVQNPLLGWNPSVSANPTLPAASNSLLSQLAAAKTTLNGSFEDRLGSSETGTLGLQFGYDDTTWGCTRLSFSVNGSGTFNLTGSGRAKILAGANEAAVSGDAAPNDIYGSFDVSDNGSGTTSAVVVSTYTPALSSSSPATLTLKLTLGASVTDSGNQNQTGTDDFDVTVDGNNPLMGSPPGGNGTPIANPQDHVHGSDSFNANLTPTSTFTLVGATYQVVDGVWKVLGFVAPTPPAGGGGSPSSPPPVPGAHLTVSAPFSNSASGDSADDEEYNNTDNPGTPNNHSKSNYQTSNGGSVTLTLDVSKADSQMRLNVSLTGQDSYGAEVDGSGDVKSFPGANDPLAARLNGPGGASGDSATLSGGQGEFEQRTGGGEKFEVGLSATVDDTGKVTPTSFSADVQTQQDDDGTDDGTGQDAGTGAGAGNSIKESSKDEVHGKSGTHLVLTGTPNSDGKMIFEAAVDANFSDYFVDGQTGSDRVNTAASGSTPSEADLDSAQENEKGSDGGFLHARYASDSTGAWTLHEWNGKVSSRDSISLTDSGNDVSGSGSDAKSDPYSDDDEEDLDVEVAFSGNGASYTETDDETLTSGFDGADTPSDPSKTADDQKGTARYHLHRELSSENGAAPTLVSANLGMNESFEDEVKGSGSVQVNAWQTTGGQGTSFQEDPDGLQPLPSDFQVHFDASPDWLENFVALIDGDFQTATQNAQASGSASTTNTVTELQDSSGHDIGSEWVQTKELSVRTVDYNLRGQVTFDQTVDPTVPSGSPHYVLSSVSYTYDDLGQLTSVTDGDGNTTSFTYTYDPNTGKLRSKTTTYPVTTDPAHHTSTETYDDEGRVVSEVNRNGMERTLTYNDAGELAGETWYAGSAVDGVTVNRLAYTYTPGGKLQTASNTETESGQTYTYQFTNDDQGRLQHVSEPWGVSLTFHYDSGGNRTEVDDSFGGRTTEQTSYDSDQIKTTQWSFTQGSQPALSVAGTYHRDGQLGTLVYQDGSTEVATSQYHYDASGRLTDLSQTGPGGISFAHYQQQYDSDGQLVLQATNGVGQSHTYDSTGQLTDAGNYSYDPNGNRTMAGYVTGADNELLEDPEYTDTYDLEGNKATKTDKVTGEKWTYGYDNLNHLTRAVKTLGTVVETEVDYQYDVFGNRIGESVYAGGTGPATVEHYAYDDWNPAKPTPVGNENWDVWADLGIDPEGHATLKTRYLRGDAVDQLFARVGSDQVAAWYLTDNLGSVRKIITSSGTVLDSLTYDAYGNILPGETNSAARGRYAWTGREYDPTTSLQYNRARYYDPESGRWISQDPLQFSAGDSNLYRYVGNNPISYQDSSGMVGGFRHHGYPLFLGGSNSQPAFVLRSVEAHNAAHNYLAQHGYPIQNPVQAAERWGALTDPERRALIRGSLSVAGVPESTIDTYMAAIMRGATPGTAVIRAPGYPGGLIRIAARRGEIAAGALARGSVRVIASPYAGALLEIFLNPTPTAGTAALRFEVPYVPPNSPDVYYLPRGTYILPNGEVYIPLPESEFGPSDFTPPPGSLVVIRSGRVVGQDVPRHFNTLTNYFPGTVAPVTSMPWILMIPENMTEEEAREGYMQFLRGQDTYALRVRYGGMYPTMTFVEWLKWRYGSE
jgi:RHS repeat-associated protein